jgi:hypothetical protein
MYVVTNCNCIPVKRTKNSFTTAFTQHAVARFADIPKSKNAKQNFKMDGSAIKFCGQAVY